RPDGRVLALAAVPYSFNLSQGRQGDLPTLIAYNLPPSATFFNQAAATIGWGGFLLLLAVSLTKSHSPAFTLPPGLRALLAFFAITLLAALASPLRTHQPWALALSNAGMILAAALAALSAAAIQQAGLALPAFRAFCIGLVVAGAVGSAVGIVQVYAPNVADGVWIATGSIPGTAVGNMRQPNHLSSLLLWAIVAALWLGEARMLRRAAAFALAALFLFVVVLSASRTGALSMLLLAGWGVLDRRLSRAARLALLAAPLVYFVFWYGTGLWADHGHHVFGGETRFNTRGDVSSSRLGIWSNTLALIRMHPWAGVGFGEFNFAWTLTPFPGRPVAFFDHTHNLPLQLLVELGVPLGLLVIALLLAALVIALIGTVRDAAAAGAPPGQATLRSAAFMMVLLILVHSLLEYPLWYAYFLLPAAFAFGLGLGPRAATAALPRAAGAKRPLLIGALLLTLGAAGALADYARVVVIFAPGEDAAPLAQRIVDGRHSVFFSHHADYAAATTADHPADVMPAFLGAPHYLLDARLLLAWAKALDEAGDTEHARYVAQRLREFRNDAAADFFAPCEAPKRPPAAAPPFQCLEPTRALSYESFR
ncbi:MAG TPA: Wzy polymerase domain-containing protein, partial [Burkholderiaceae bacterium]|nr:Wzy polymerase domain-containing protein [Burkholderiaceae bacterium]